jgi:hypothetical protein
VRVLSPINIRELIGVGGECGMYISCVCTGMSTQDGQFSNRARSPSGELAMARSAAGLRTFTAALERFVPRDADVVAAHNFFTRIVPWEVPISNLGVQHLDDTGPSGRPHCGSAGTHPHRRRRRTRIVTYDGRPRMVACGYTSAPTTSRAS